MTDDTRAMSATGLLATFNAAGALTWSDVHPAQQWGYLFGEADPRVLLAAALTVRALRLGSICLPLDRLRELDQWEDAVELDPSWWPEQTAEFTYARLQSSQEDEPAGYSTAEIDRWAMQARQWAEGGRDVFVFFIAGAKVRNPAAAQALIAQLHGVET